MSVQPVGLCYPICRYDTHNGWGSYSLL